MPISTRRSAGGGKRDSRTESLGLGGFEFRSIRAGEMRIDGGSCFGTIPKPVWRKWVSPDRKNRVPLALRPILFRNGSGTTLVDAGLGGAVDERVRALLSYDGGSEEERFLERAGVAPESVDRVVFTHLHSDHMGGAFRPGGAGRVETIFPNAEFFARRGEWEEAVKPSPLVRPGYVTELLDALESTGRLRLVEEDGEIAPGVELIGTGGHTPHHQAVMVRTGEGPVLIPGDLVPTAAHIRLACICALDLDRVTSYEQKERLLRETAGERGFLILYHETGTAIGRIEEAATRRFEWVRSGSRNL